MKKKIMYTLKKLVSVPLVLILIILSLTAYKIIPTKKVTKATASTAEKGFVVVELFTSEGCSSCPPADELMVRLEKKSAGRPLYILAYHVDYFDKLGWKDTFGNSANARRQMQYAKWLRLSQLYTPQVILNGESEFVGSEESSIRQTISSLQAEKSSTGILLRTQVAKKVINVHYKASGDFGNQELLIALIQKSASTPISSGENGGRTLSHVQIVREWKTAALDGNGQGNILLHLPGGDAEKDWEVIGLIQSRVTGRISAAGKTAITAQEPTKNTPD